MCLVITVTLLICHLSLCRIFLSLRQKHLPIFGRSGINLIKYAVLLAGLLEDNFYFFLIWVFLFLFFLSFFLSFFFLLLTVFSTFFDLNLPPLTPNIFFCFLNHQGTELFFLLNLFSSIVLQWYHEVGNFFLECVESNWLF